MSNVFTGKSQYPLLAQSARNAVELDTYFSVTADRDEHNDGGALLAAAFSLNVVAIGHPASVLAAPPAVPEF